MKSVTAPSLSALVREQVAKPSPIRQIMKMAERQNILEMGLDPATVISFGGGWVNHAAPEEFRQAYQAIVSDPELFHKSGAYTATLGDMECREQIARFEEHLFGVPRLGAEHIAIGLGSTQLTHDLFRTLLDPGDTVMLLDPTYANYEGQLAFATPGVKVVRLRVLDPQTWSYLPETDPAGVAREFTRLFDLHRPKLVLFGAPDNPTSQVVPQALAEVMLAKTADAGAWLAIDFAYKCQYFQAPPLYYAWSPADHPNVIGIHSNSKWSRGLGRRLGWLEAHPPVIEAIERVQQCSILCPDTLSQMAMARYLRQAIGDGSLRRYVDHANALYKQAAQITVDAVDRHLGRPRLQPFGGLYTVVDVGTNAEAFVPKALKATGVLVVPGAGFGASLTNGVRISFGPLVMDTAKIEEGLSRLGAWMKGA
ncbi:MAG: pyridoxal phosphate-dependent aminotransferase [Vicinamibacterales bacterium]